MPTTVAGKLRIKANDTLLSINAPGNFQKGLHPLPPGVTVTSSSKTYDQVHWFVMNKAQVAKELGKVMKLVKPGVIVWVYYPKGSSKLQTDLTRDKGWDCLLAEGDKLTWISLISFNDTWSTFGFRAKTDADKKKEAQPKVEREIFKWVNPSTKEVKIPAELSAAFRKNKKANDFFSTLSFTNKKEYVGWIVTAKRDETKKERVAATIDRLKKGWKNPGNT